MLISFTKGEKPYIWTHILFLMCMCVHFSVCVCFLSVWMQVPTEAWRWPKIPWSWSYQWLWDTWCGYWAWNLGPLGRAEHNLSHWPISTFPKFYIWKEQVKIYVYITRTLKMLTVSLTVFSLYWRLQLSSPRRNCIIGWVIAALPSTSGTDGLMSVLGMWTLKRTN